MPLISPAVTELTESLGVFLPPFGLYALLAEIKIPLVVTSCNLTGEPIIYKQADAFAADIDTGADDHTLHFVLMLSAEAADQDRKSVV